MVSFQHCFLSLFLFASSCSRLSDAAALVCQDDPTFQTHNLKCADVRDQDCRTHHDGNRTSRLSYKTTLKLIRNCPQACNVPCDELDVFDTRVQFVLNKLHPAPTPGGELSSLWPLNYKSCKHLERIAFEYVTKQKFDGLHLGVVSLDRHREWSTFEDQKKAGKKKKDPRTHAPAVEVIMNFKGYLLGDRGNHTGSQIIQDLFQNGTADFVEFLRPSGGPMFESVEITSAPGSAIMEEEKKRRKDGAEPWAEAWFRYGSIVAAAIVTVVTASAVTLKSRMEGRGRYDANFFEEDSDYEDDEYSSDGSSVEDDDSVSCDESVGSVESVEREANDNTPVV